MAEPLAGVRQVCINKWFLASAQQQGRSALEMAMTI